MAAFRRALADFDIDGIWLDYHHAHASWEQPVPSLPDTCFCPGCLAAFRDRTGLTLPDDPAAAARTILDRHRDAWVDFRCAVLTSWVAEFEAIRDEVRPAALLGVFHCPWSDEDFDGALRNKLFIDLKAWAPLVDVLSPMPYHARFGHADDPAWISRQTAWLGRHLGLKGDPGERPRVWPILQASDWGETVAPADIPRIVAEGAKPPASGLMVFAWGSFAPQPGKLDALRAAYRALDR
jgi:hypothetical protein